MGSDDGRRQEGLQLLHALRILLRVRGDGHGATDALSWISLRFRIARDFHVLRRKRADGNQPHARGGTLRLERDAARARDRDAGRHHARSDRAYMLRRGRFDADALRIRRKFFRNIRRLRAGAVEIRFRLCQRGKLYGGRYRDDRRRYRKGGDTRESRRGVPGAARHRPCAQRDFRQRTRDRRGRVRVCRRHALLPS